MRKLVFENNTLFTMKQLFTFFIFLLFFAGNVFSQSVSLVLSGGGAKGLAHIGVIKALEENNIPIDYISGTSMGAIVGGLYAAGYSTAEMEELFRSEQFKFWTTGKIQEEYRYYFSKLEENPAWLSLDLERDEDKLKLVLPTNIIPEEQMDFAFMELFSTTNAVCNYNFDQLFIPFLCIATDVYNNSEVEMRSGDLGEAIRGSMTFPLYFKPIEIDGALVFDGGIVNNFPVKNSIDAFEPDVVIGHKVANNAPKPDEDDVMAQLENLIMQKTDFEIPADVGFLLESSFSDVSLLDFDKIDMIIEAGYETGLSMVDSIKMRVKREIKLSEVNRKREIFNSNKPELLFQNIQVEGSNDTDQRRFIIQRLKHKSNVIKLEELRKEYFKLVADPQIQSIRPVSLYNPITGYFDLNLKVKREKPIAFNFGGNASTRPINQGFLSFDYRVFKKRAYTFSSNIYFGRFYSSIKTGTRIDFATKLPYYISTYFTLNRWDYYVTSNDFFFENVSLPFIIQEEMNVRSEIGFPVGTWGKLVGGASWVSSSDSYYLNTLLDESGIDEVGEADQTDFDAFSANVSFERNSFNYKQFPTEGISSFLGLTYVTGNEDYQSGISGLEGFKNKNHDFFIIKGSYDKYFEVSKDFTFGFLAEGVFSNKGLFSNYRSSVIGLPSFTPTPYSKTIFEDNFRANKYMASGLKGIWKMSDQLHLRLEAYGFLPLQKVIQSNDKQIEYDTGNIRDTKIMASGGLIVHSGVGPISLTLNYFDRKNEKSNLHVVFSFGYVLFNKRGY